MESNMIINNSRETCIFDIDLIEKKYNAKYVGEFCIQVEPLRPKGRRFLYHRAGS